MQCQNLDVFQALLDYMYTGNMVIAAHRVPELLRLSNHFLIDHLKQGCVEFLEHNITPANCFTIKEQIERCGCQVVVNLVIFTENITVYYKLHKITVRPA